MRKRKLEQGLINYLISLLEQINMLLIGHYRDNSTFPVARCPLVALIERLLQYDSPTDLMLDTTFGTVALTFMKRPILKTPSRQLIKDDLSILIITEVVI